MKLTILTILLSIFLYNFVISGELLDIRKIAENAILIRFNDNVTYRSSLSIDKKNISIEIENSKNSLKKNSQRIDSKLIEEVFVQKKNENLLLNVILDKSSGYNTYKLPYSNSIVVSVFDWNALSQDADKFRSALFAYESSLYKQAVLLLDEAKNTVPEAHSMLGIIYLLEDSLQSSFSELNIAARNDTYIPDVYAALSQIYSERGSQTKAQYFEDKFKSKLGVRDSAFEYPKLIFTEDGIDSLQISGYTDSSNADLEEINANKRFSNLFDQSGSKNTTIARNKSELESEDSFLVFKGFLKYVIIFSLLLVLALVALYLKWRRVKIDAQNQKAKEDFEKELLKASTPPKNEQGIVIDRTDDVAELISKKITPQIAIRPEEIVQFGSGTNIVSEDRDKRIEAKKILSSIEKSGETESNLNTSFNKLDNSKLKSKLYKKYNVDNSDGNQ